MKNNRFRAESAATRFGRSHSMVASGLAAVTGLDCLNVLIDNPQQVSVIFTDAGQLLRETPTGSGTMVPVATPLPLPMLAYMQDALADNMIYMAISDLSQGLLPPMVLNGPTGVVSVAGQNPVGALWQPNVWYQVGDLVRSPDGRWWRCTTAGTQLSGELPPSWPALNGYWHLVHIPINHYEFVTATASDPVGGSAWSEWTPNVGQYYPAPDVSGMSLSRTGGTGSIPASKDVYVKLTYLVNGAIYSGESPRSAAVVFTNTVLNDSLVLTRTGDILGGVTMPQWLATVFTNSFIFTDYVPILNVWVAAVNTGAAAPADSAYFNLGTVSPATGAIFVSSIPNSNAAVWTQGAPIIFDPQSTGNQAGGVFIGEGGTRYFAVLRENSNGSLSPVDPQSPMPFNAVGRVEVEIINIERDSSGNVTATVGDIAGYAPAQRVQVVGVKDTSFNSPVLGFSLTSVQQTLNPQGILKWSDPSHLSAANDNTGAIILPAGPPPVAFLPPGGPNDIRDIVAFTTIAPIQSSALNLQAGPFNFIAKADPQTVVSTPILSMQGPLTLNFTGISLTRDAGGNVSAALTDIAGIEPGALVTVAKASDSSFDGLFALVGVTPGSGTAGILTWQQLDDSASTATGAVLTIGIEELGQVQAIVQNPTGLAAGDIVNIINAAPAAFNGPVPIASVIGNVVTFPSDATGNATTPGTMVLLQTLPTVCGVGPSNITSIQRDAFGNVSAVIPRLLGWTAGQWVRIVLTDDISFTGSFQLITATLNNDLVTATLTWFQGGALPAAISENGQVTSSPILTCNFDDDALDADDVTSQLTAMAPPECVDAFFSETLNRMVYTKGNDTFHYFSNIGDNENIDSDGGIVPVAENNGAVTVCFREMESGELLSLKANGGYALEPNDNTPDGWAQTRRWKKHGPVNARAVALGPDFLVMFVEYSGPYRYDGHSLEWIGRERQGTWDRVNWEAKSTIWVEVDDDANVVHFGLPLDGATSPNKDVSLNFFDGWQEPLTENMAGQVIPNRRGRRWSEDDLPATSGKLVLRTLNPGVDARLNDRQMLFGMGRLPGATQAFVDLQKPDKYSDDGVVFADGAWDQDGIDWQYQPAYAQSPTFEIFRWSKIKGRYLGSGDINFQPLTEDPDFTVEPLISESKEGVPTKFAFGVDVEGDNEMLTFNINNGKVPGAWAELHGLVIGGNEAAASQETQ